MLIKLKQRMAERLRKSAYNSKTATELSSPALNKGLSAMIDAFRANSPPSFPCGGCYTGVPINVLINRFCCEFRLLQLVI